MTGQSSRSIDNKEDKDLLLALRSRGHDLINSRKRNSSAEDLFAEQTTLIIMLIAFRQIKKLEEYKEKEQEKKLWLWVLFSPGLYQQQKNLLFKSCQSECPQHCDTHLGFYKDSVIGLFITNILNPSSKKITLEQGINSNEYHQLEVLTALKAVEQIEINTIGISWTGTAQIAKYEVHQEEGYAAMEGNPPPPPYNPDYSPEIEQKSFFQNVGDNVKSNFDKFKEFVSSSFQSSGFDIILDLLAFLCNIIVWLVTFLIRLCFLTVKYLLVGLYKLVTLGPEYCVSFYKKATNPVTWYYDYQFRRFYYNPIARENIYNITNELEHAFKKAKDKDKNYNEIAKEFAQAAFPNSRHSRWQAEANLPKTLKIIRALEHEELPTECKKEYKKINNLGAIMYKGVNITPRMQSLLS